MKALVSDLSMTVNDLIDALQSLPDDIKKLEVYKGIAGYQYPIFKGTAWSATEETEHTVERPERFVLE